MYKIIISLFLLVYLVYGCDSTEPSLPSNSGQATMTFSSINYDLGFRFYTRGDAPFGAYVDLFWLVLGAEGGGGDCPKCPLRFARH